MLQLEGYSVNYRGFLPTMKTQARPERVFLCAKFSPSHFFATSDTENRE